MQVQFLGQEDPLEEGMTTYSSILAWEISWTEEPGKGGGWVGGGGATVHRIAESYTTDMT